MSYMNSSNSRETMAMRTHEEMKDVLMSREGVGPDVHYYMIRGGSDKKNITVLECGTVDGEYIKAYGHYHVDDLGEIYNVLSGQGIMLLQKRKVLDDGTVINDEVDWIKAIFISPGSVVNIEPKIGHLIINIGGEWLVTSDNSPVAMSREEKASWPVHADYKPVKDLQGFAYYVVKGVDGPSFIKNLNYKNTPEIIIENL
jgi:oxalate decarboxylase/phosphoglucose isomerase-like protein (cupin superfamily)